MQSSAGGSQRAPGAFNPNTSSTSSIAASTAAATTSAARQPGRISSLESSPNIDKAGTTRLQRSRHVSPERPQLQTSFANDSHSRYPTLNSSTPNLHYSSRPSASYISAASTARGNSPLRLVAKSSDSDFRQRKHANSQGFFEPSLPSTGSSNMGNADTMERPQMQAQTLSASQIAAQAAMQYQSHQRKRSQTMPVDQAAQRRPSGSRGHASPPLLSVTEASGERYNGFGQGQQYSRANQGGPVYRNGLMSGTTVNPAATAASVVFGRSPMVSPNLGQADVNPFKEPEKPAKTERSKMKLFSKPGKLTGLGKDKEGKEKAPGSPSKLGFTTQQSRANSSSALSLADPTQSSGSSMYSHANSSQATIRASDSASTNTGHEKEPGKEKKHHHFLSRQKQKLSGKDDRHLLLSSAKSNSMPVDPLEKPIYNFNLPPSPGPAATSFSKSMSGLDLRHGGRALREKKREEKSAANQSFAESGLRESETSADWAGPSSLGSTTGAAVSSAASIYAGDAADLGSYGLQNMSPDDAWPLLKSKILVVFQGEGKPLKMTIEDLNKLVTTHLQQCIRKRSPMQFIDDFRDIITTGFRSIEPRLQNLDDVEIIPALVEMWKLCYLKVIPYLMAVFLPLDLEFEGHGPLMSPAVARDFWGALPLSSLSNGSKNPTPVPAYYLLSVRRIALTTYRDVMILPRFDKIMYLFSSMNLNNIGNAASRTGYSSSPNHLFTLSTSPNDRPGTSGSLDPAFASFNSTTTTLLNGSQADSESSGARSRGLSNVSFGSDQRDAVYAHTTANTSRGNVAGLSSSQRDVNRAEALDAVETVGRMLQCMSVLSSVGIIPGDGSEVRAQREAAERREASGSASGSGGRARGYSTGMVEDEAAQQKIDGLCRALKLNWLGRGRTGRNRKGFVGARTRTNMPTVA